MRYSYKEYETNTMSLDRQLAESWMIQYNNCKDTKNTKEIQGGAPTYLPDRSLRKIDERARSYSFSPRK